MPPAKDDGSKHGFGRSFSNSGVSMSARVYHPATNLMPASPPQSPITGAAPPFPPRATTTSSWGRQNSHNGKYS